MAQLWLWGPAIRERASKQASKQAPDHVWLQILSVSVSVWIWIYLPCHVDGPRRARLYLMELHLVYLLCSLELNLLPVLNPKSYDRHLLHQSRNPGHTQHTSESRHTCKYFYLHDIGYCVLLTRTHGMPREDAVVLNQG